MRNEIVKLLENEDFVKKIIIMEDAEEVKKSFKENGVEVSDSELDEVGSVMNEIVEILNKMPEEELKSVSGGNNNEMKNNKEMRNNNVWGVNFIRKTVGYKPEQYSNQIIKSNVGVGRFSCGKEIEGIQLLSREQTTGSEFKDFVGKNANEIALGSMVAASTAMLIGGAYGVKELVIWYKNRH